MLRCRAFRVCRVRPPTAAADGVASAVIVMFGVYRQCPLLYRIIVCIAASGVVPAFPAAPYQSTSYDRFFFIRLHLYPVRSRVKQRFHCSCYVDG